MMNLNYQMILILYQTFKIISNLSLKHKTSTIVSPIQAYINGISQRLVFQIKNWYKLALQTPETMKLFSCTEKVIGKATSGEKVPSLEVVEIFFSPM